MDKSTPRPWHGPSKSYPEGQFLIYRKDDPHPVAYFRREDEAGVAVRAVNVFDALVEALREIIARDCTCGCAHHAREIARAALALAKETP